MYFEYPCTVAMLLREIRYGIDIGFINITVDPFRQSSDNDSAFSYHVRLRRSQFTVQMFKVSNIQWYHHRRVSGSFCFSQHPHHPLFLHEFCTDTMTDTLSFQINTLSFSPRSATSTWTTTLTHPVDRCQSQCPETTCASTN